MNKWDSFFEEKIKKIFTEKKTIIDIGGGLRIEKEKNNRDDKKREWILEYKDKVDYKIIDPVPDYNPDIVGDIHDLPFSDNSQDAVVCMAVLEHVEDPKKACEEIKRVLKPGGYAFFYVPFLFYYHAETGYYKDYWRFTKDSLNLLFKGFSRLEIEPVRGRFETWIHLSPLGRIKLLASLFNFLDTVFKKDSKQVSGYNIFVVK